MKEIGLITLKSTIITKRVLESQMLSYMQQNLTQKEQLFMHAEEQERTNSEHLTTRMDN